MDKRIYIRVPDELLEKFDRACEANYTTKSEVLRRAMLDYVRGNKKGEEKMKGAHDYTYVLVTQTQLMHPELDDSEELTEGEAIKLIRDFDGVETNKGIWAFPDGSQLYRKGGAK